MGVLRDDMVVSEERETVGSVVGEGFGDDEQMVMAIQSAGELLR